MRLHVAKAAGWLPPWCARRLVILEKNKINKMGELVIQSSRHRTQLKNLVGRCSFKSHETRVESAWLDMIHRFQVLLSISTCGASSWTTRWKRCRCASTARQEGY
jgi:uncharacterized FlgJ-related protein